MKISPNEPAMPIKDVGFMPDEDGGQIAFATTQGAFNANFTGLTIRAELAARMPGLGDGSYKKETIDALAGYQYDGDNPLLMLKRWADADAAYKIIHADSLINQLNKTSSNEQ